jgi:hypothetical protein
MRTRKSHAVIWSVRTPVSRPIPADRIFDRRCLDGEAAAFKRQGADLVGVPPFFIPGDVDVIGHFQRLRVLRVRGETHHPGIGKFGFLQVGEFFHRLRGPAALAGFDDEAAFGGDHQDPVRVRAEVIDGPAGGDFLPHRRQKLPGADDFLRRQGCRS